MENPFSTQCGIRRVFQSTKYQGQRNPLRAIPLALLALIVGVSFTIPSSYSAEGFKRARAERSYVVAEAFKLWPAASALSLETNPLRPVAAYFNAPTVE